MSKLETEIKLRVGEIADVEEKIRSIGATQAKARYFEDNYVLDTPDQKLRSSRTLLRVRFAGENSGILTMKRNPTVANGVKEREEIECTVDKPANLLTIFSHLGFQPAFRYQKYRTVYRMNDVDICVDETPIGNYLELDGPVAAIHDCALRLGFTRADYIVESYSSLYFRWCDENHQQPANMIFT